MSGLGDLGGGARANRSGRSAEDAIADLLLRKRVDFSRQVPVGSSIYGTPIRADFVVWNLEQFASGLAIESKWQDVAGSADEKFPYLVANIRAGNYRYPVIVVVYGGGFREGAIRWLRAEVDDDRLIAVFSFEELLSWFHRFARVHVTSPQLPWTTRSSRA